MTVALALNGNGSIAGLAAGLNGVGKIVQMQVASGTAAASNSTLTYSTLLTQTITPTSASSKIIAVGFATMYVNPVTNSYGQLTLFRGATTLTFSVIGSNSAILVEGSMTPIAVDSPASTSTLTYSLQFRAASSGTASAVLDNNAPYFLILLEVAP